VAVSERNRVKRLQAKVPEPPEDERLTLNQAAQMVGVSSRAIERYVSRLWRNGQLRLKTWRDPVSGRRYTTREWLREAELVGDEVEAVPLPPRRSRGGRQVPSIGIAVAVPESVGEAALLRVVAELQQENLRLRLRVAQLEAEAAER
jgi:hypothetical protein